VVIAEHLKNVCYFVTHKPATTGLAALTIVAGAHLPALLREWSDPAVLTVAYDLTLNSILAGLSAFSLSAATRMLSPSYSYSDSKTMIQEWRKVRRTKASFPKHEGYIEPNITKALLATLRGEEHRAKKVAEEANILLLCDMAEDSMRKGRLDEGLIQLRDCLEIVGLRKIKYPRWKLPVADLAQALDKFFNPSEETELLAGVVNQVLWNRYNRAFRTSLLARNLTDIRNSSNRREVYVFHALLSSALHSTTAQQDWRDACNVIREDPIWERIGETRSIVRTIKDSKFLSKSILFKESDSLEDLVQEAENINALQDIIGDRAVLPEILYTSDKKDPFIVMRFLEGDTLLQRLEQEDYSSMPDIISSLAKIHKYVPEDAKKLSIPYYVRSRLISDHFGISRGIAKQIVSNYRPVYNALKNAPFVYNKDAHPENWIISKDKLGIIDCEGRTLVPAQFDLVNLLEYGDFFFEDQKREYLDIYLSQTKQDDRDSFMLGYWNAVIHRMIGLSSAWSSPIRPSMHNKRHDAISRALRAINVIESDFSDYFNEYKEQYQNLRDGFNQITELLIN
jgi:aminoglycoside phosphotransferase (APT) family kinase protein